MARRTATPQPPEQPEQPGEASASAATMTVDTAPAPTIEESAVGAPDAASAESGFFAWIRRLELPRRTGWLGGVCAGIADRIGIDPLIVRGIVVVLAVVGAPVVLLYAVAWFLLPDERGTIHAQELGHGRVTRALPGIIAVFLVSFLPLTQGFWYTGALYWNDFGWGGAFWRIAWTALVLVAVIVAVVVLANRTSSTSELPTTPATTDDRPETVPSFPADAVVTPADADTAAGVLAASAAPGAPIDPGEPPAPPADASAEELAAWKQSQDEWQKQRAAWAAEQRRSERERQQAEAHVRAVAAAEAARERARIRRLTRPRASAGVVFLVLGVALLAGAVAAFTAPTRGGAGSEWATGAAVTTLVLGVGIVAVGFARRRTGFLSLLGLLSVLVLLGSLFVPTDRQLIALGASWNPPIGEGGRFAQLAGNTWIFVEDRDPAVAPVVDLWQLAGSLNVSIQEGATLRLEVTTERPDAGVSIQEEFPTTGGRQAWYQIRKGRLDLTIGSGQPDLVLRVWIGSTIYPNVGIAAKPSVLTPLDPEPDERNQWDGDGVQVPLPSLAPDATPIPTEGALP